MNLKRINWKKGSRFEWREVFGLFKFNAFLDINEHIFAISDKTIYSNVAIDCEAVIFRFR